MKDLNKDLRLSLLSMIPVVGVTAADILIPWMLGYGLSVGGISVCAVLMGACARCVASINVVVAERASKEDLDNRGSLYGVLWVGVALSTLIALSLWYWRDTVEMLVGLEGISQYLVWGPWYWLCRQYSKACYVPLGINQEKMAARAVASWVLCLANIVLTYYYVQTEGVSGSSKATLVAMVPSLLLGMWWSRANFHKFEFSAFLDIWGSIKQELKGSTIQLANSMTALALNGWMGGEVALIWSLCHMTCDIAGELGNSLWAVGQRHLGYWRYGAGGDAVKGLHAWKLADMGGIAINVIGAVLAAIYVDVCAAIIVIAYASNKRFACRVAAQGSEDSSEIKFQAKKIWVFTCIIGYWLTMTLVAPTYVVPTIVYACAAAGSSTFLYKKLK